MDFITQGIAGATLSQLGASNKNIRYATIAGLVAGTIPDLDFLIRSPSDPLLNLEMHRQFSHALIFIPVGALIASLLLWPWMKRALPFYKIYFFCALGYSIAGILDACTSFGTQLLWPFTDLRIAWNLIAIVDPVFSLVLAVLAFAAWKFRNRKYAMSGLLFAFLYLMLAFTQQQQAYQLQAELASARGHQPDKQLVKPTLGNIILWRSVYFDKDYYYVDAIRIGLLGTPRIIPGHKIRAYVPPDYAVDLSYSNIHYQDILRFQTLSQGYLVRHPDDSQVIGDVRYAMLPNSIKPLWGIRVNPSMPNSHVSEALFRDNSVQTRKRFLDMLVGN